MIRFTTLREIIPRKIAARVRMEPFGEEGANELFGNKTEELARAFHEQVIRYRIRNGIPLPASRTYEEKREVSKWYLEHTAFVGALAAARATSGSRVYDLGGAAGFASIAYALISGKPIALVDKEKSETEHAREMVNHMGVDGLVEIVNGLAEEVIGQRGLGPEDIAIFSEPAGTLNDYWKKVLSDYGPRVILNEGMMLHDEFGRDYARVLQDEIITKFAEEHMVSKRYDVEAARSNFSTCQVVFLCTKNTGENNQDELNR